MSDSLDLRSESDSGSGPKPRPFDDHDRLSLAKWILGVCAFMLILTSGIYAFNDSDSAKQVFTMSWHGVPPIITLVIGYFFGKR